MRRWSRERETTERTSPTVKVSEMSSDTASQSMTAVKPLLRTLLAVGVGGERERKR